MSQDEVRDLQPAQVNATAPPTDPPPTNTQFPTVTPVKPEKPRTLVDFYSVTDPAQLDELIAQLQLRRSALAKSSPFSDPTIHQVHDDDLNISGSSGQAPATVANVPSIQSRFDKPSVHLDKYKPTDDAAVFLRSFAMATAHFRSPAERCRQFLLYLGPEASSFITGTTIRLTRWEDMEATFLSQFAPDRTRRLREQITNSKYIYGADLNLHFMKLEHLYRELHGAHVTEEDLIHTLAASLPEKLQFLMTAQAYDLNTAKSVALHAADYQKRKMVRTPVRKATAAVVQEEEESARIAVLDQEMSEVTADATPKSTPPKKPGFIVHKKSGTPTTPRVVSNEQIMREMRRLEKTVQRKMAGGTNCYAQCFNCGAIDHFIRDCPALAKEQTKNATRVVAPRAQGGETSDAAQ